MASWVDVQPILDDDDWVDVNPVPGTEPIPGTEERAWPTADAVIDARGKYVMPGIVDTHVH